MKNLIRVCVMLAGMLFLCGNTFCQTSWTGNANTNWNNAGNWTAGVPNSTTNAILGDANFTGSNQPSVNAPSSCNSITIGGVVATSFTLRKNLVVNGNFTINNNGDVTQPNSTVTVKGDWINNGSYATSNNNAKLVFGGRAQAISGTITTTFRKVTVNTGSTITLRSNVTFSGSGSYIYIYGTIDPGQSPTYTLTSTGSFRIYNNGKIKVNAATFAANFNLSGSVNFYEGSIVEYASTNVNQAISSAYSYSTLVISGSGTKSLTGNLPALISTSATRGNIFVTGGTLDMGTYTANRGTSVTGGELNIYNGAFLKIGGTSNFPSNFSTRTFALSSTVEYNGTAQTIPAQTYGNLIFSSGSGGSVKTMPATVFTIEGNFTSITGTGSSVSYTSAADITINGNVNIGASTSFNGGANNHIVRGNWINNGTFNGNTGTLTFDGPSMDISGTGVQNFNNLAFSRSGITASSATINVSGNISTTTPGTFTHVAGLITMTGTSKTISGTNIIFNSLTVSGSVSTGASFAISGNLVVPGSFTGNAGALSMTGTSKTITGTGTILFSTLRALGSITTTSSFSISALLDVTGTFTASAGVATFTGNSMLSGMANLYNVALNGTSLQLSFLAVLGIANTFTVTAGMLDVTSSIPNTVNFNGNSAQAVNAIAYHHLALTNGNTKTAAGAVTVNGNINIGTATTFNGSTYIHTVMRNWINNGTYTPSTSTVQFTGASNASISGTTTFKTLVVNKSTASTSLSLINNVSASTVNMVAGTMLTGSNTLTITTTRTGNGIILGTITRTHGYTTGTAYAFEGPNNTISFSSVSGVTSVTVIITKSNIIDFPNAASINREYNISIPAGTYTAALRLHYEDVELNGNNEPSMKLWNYSGLNWVESGKTANSTTVNYVEQSGLTNISYRWSCSETPAVVRWNGSAGTNWNTAANWTVISGTPSTPPAANDIVHIGSNAFTNQPTISNVVTVKSITFGSAQAAVLTLVPGGSLTTSGNINGNWTGNAIHTINAADQNITINGSLSLSNGTSNRSINVGIRNGTVAILGNLAQSGDAAINFSGNGSLNIGDDYNYYSGTFNAGAGTVNYNGTGAQSIGAVTYNNLVVNKTSGIAVMPAVATVLGDLSVISGTLDKGISSVTINGTVNISPGAGIECDGGEMTVAGNWNNNGSYFSATGSVIMNGTAAQSISASSFNNLVINKSAGVATLLGNIVIEGDFTVQAGTLNLLSYNANRRAIGGMFIMTASATLIVGGANNFPANFSTVNMNAGSLVHYNSTTAQTVKGLTYGNLTLSNGGSYSKTQAANAVVAGELLINAGSTFNSGGFSTALGGNWSNAGTFVPSTGTVILNGVNKTITGNTTFNDLNVNGSYTVGADTIIFNGRFWVTTGASYISSGTTTFNGDLTNNGTLVGNGTTTFTGTSIQTIRLVNALQSTSNGVVNFNGNVSPVLNSNSSPQFATLNVNNTAGLNPSVGGVVMVALNISTGAVLNLGNAIYTIYGSFTNAGTLTSTGTLNFSPPTAKTIAFGNTGFSSNGIVNFGGTGLITITGTPGVMNAVIISNTNNAGVTAPSNWIIDSNFVITQHAIFNAGTFTYTVGGNIESDGTLNGGTSTFIMTAANAELTASSETSFNNFTVAGSAVVTPQTDFRVAGNFMNNGIYDGSIGVLIMTGENSASIGGSTTPSSISQLAIQKSGNATVTQAVNLSDLLFLDIFSGTLFTSTYSIMQDANGGVLVINDSATLKLGGTNALPGFSGYGLDVNSYVDYAGASTTQNIGNAADYGNLVISGAGNKNAYTALTILGDLVISAGTLNSSTFSVAHSIAGDFVMTGGTITGTNSTYILNGSSDQRLELLSNLVKLTVNKPGGLVRLGANVTVNNTLNFISGIIETGNYKAILPSTGTLTGAAQNTGWVKGNLQKNVATGSPVSRVFETGSSVHYSPVTVLFATVSTAGNLVAGATATDHPQVDYSGIDSSRTVNRFWSITNSGIVFTSATATFNWVAPDIDAGVNLANLKVGVYNGTGWNFTTCTAALPTSIQATALTGFGDFAFGESQTWYKWTGEAFTADWATAKNWSGGIPTAAYTTLIPAGITGGRVYPLLSTGTGTVSNITIDNGAALTISGGSLQISGTVLNNGVLNAAAGTIEFNGSTAQTVPAALFANNLVKDLLIKNNVSLEGTTILKGTLTVAAGKTLTTNNYLVLGSDSSGTARIASLPVNGSGIATAFITGNVSIERYIPLRKAWRMLSAPVRPAGAPSVNSAWQEGLTTASANPNLYPGYGVHITGGTVANGFDQGLTTATTIKVFNNATGNFVPLPATGTHTPITNYPGYFIYIRGDRSINLAQGNAAAITPTTLRIKGQVNSGNQVSNVNATGYTILGNPFASAIDFETLTKTNVKNSFYVWDPRLAGNYGLGGYVTFSWNNGTGTYDATTAASPVSKYIPSGEAIIIESADGINPGTVTIKESDKTANGNDHAYGRFNNLDQHVRVNLYSVNPDGSTALLDAVLTTYDDENLNSIDNNDAGKLNGSGENIGIKRQTRMLAIERRKTISVNDTTFLNLSQVKVQSYRLEIGMKNMHVTGTIATIRDNYSNTINNMPLDMNGTTTVTFNVNSDPASYAANRFKIIFEIQTPLPVTFKEIRAYRQDKHIPVEWETGNEINISSYNVERSGDGRNFYKINTTLATAINGGSAAYQFIDSHPLTGNNYYRVRSSSKDGEFLYSSIVKVFMEAMMEVPAVAVYPNPVTGNMISLHFNNIPNGIYSLELFNAAGQLVAVKQVTHQVAVPSKTFLISNNFAAGRYELKIRGNGVELNTPVLKR